MTKAIPSIIPHAVAPFRNVRIVPPYARHLTCRVQQGEVDMEIGDFLMHRFPFRSRSGWLERLNDGRIVQGDAVLQPGMRLRPDPPLTFFTPAQTEPSVPDEVAILEDTEDYLLVYKPAPLPVHPGGRYNRNTLTSILHELTAHTGNSDRTGDPVRIESPGRIGGPGRASDTNHASDTSRASDTNHASDPGRAGIINHDNAQNRVIVPGRTRVLHRLDSVTSGLILFGRSNSFSKKVRQAFADGNVEKTYLAVVSGTPGVDRITIEKPIRRKDGYIFECALNGKASSTSFDVLIRGEHESGSSAALVRCRPQTGRTHQIRLHLREWGHPVIDDPLYGFSQVRQDSTSGCPMQNWGISLLHHTLKFPQLHVGYDLFDYFPRPDVPGCQPHD